MVRPLIVFGLRGTLIERLHTARVPITMPPAHHSIGMHKIWVRNGVHECVEALKPSCDLAIWSSTTTRNTVPIIEAVFGPKSSLGDGNGPFKFIWTREHTRPDDFRRGAPTDAEDENATLKVLDDVFKVFPQYSPVNTILVDDTPSKCRADAGNFLWVHGLKTDAKSMSEDKELEQLTLFVKNSILKAKDVQAILPHAL